MNIQEAIKTIEKLGEHEHFVDEPISKKSVLNIINQIYIPQKQKVPQVAVEFYERYKDDDLDLGEWFGDFYSPEAIEGFPRMDELAEWLHDNDDETNRQREFALATLVTFGVDAVEVEKEKLYTVEIPNNGGTLVLTSINGRLKLDHGYKHFPAKLTEEKIREKFDWAWQWAEPVEEE